MEIKYVIFAVSAILAQTFAQSLPVASITADSTANSITNSTADLSKMLLNEESTLQNEIAAFDLIFERITKMTVEQIYNDTPSSNYNASATTDAALLRIKDAVDSSLNNTLTITGRTTCDAVDGARRRSYLVLERIWANITEAIAIVESSNSTDSDENTNGISEKVSRILTKHQSKVRNDFEGIVSNIVRAAVACAEITSIDELQVIRIYHDRMDLALHKATNSLFNAIRYYAYARANGNPDLRLVQFIDQEKTKANVALVHNVESSFAMMEAIYINTSLNETQDIFAELAEVVYTRKFAYYRFKGAATALMSRIDGYLLGETLDFAEAGEEDFSLDDAAQASVAHQWKSGTQQILNSFESENSSAVGHFPEELSTIISAVAANFATQLHLAKTAPEESDTVPQIDDLNAKAAAWAVKYVNAVYKAMLNGNNATTSIQTSKKSTETQMKIFMDGMSRLYKILAEVVSKSKSVDDVNDSVNWLKRQVYSAVSEITQSIFTARVSIVSNA